MSHILVVEDCPDIAAGLIELFEENHRVTHARDLAEAKAKLVGTNYDLIVMDVSLPDGTGFELCEYIKKENLTKAPIIFLTGQSDLQCRMKGLELGAQDYILKPFYKKELMLRVDMRLQQFNSAAPIMSFGDLKFEKLYQRVRIEVENSNEALNLTPSEYKILSLLAESEGKTLSRKQIVDCVWGPDFNLSEKVVNTHISNLRNKIKKSQCKILLAKGKGYFLQLNRTA